MSNNATVATHLDPQMPICIWDCSDLCVYDSVEQSNYALEVPHVLDGCYEAGLSFWSVLGSYYRESENTVVMGIALSVFLASGSIWGEGVASVAIGTGLYGAGKDLYQILLGSELGTGRSLNDAERGNKTGELIGSIFGGLLSQWGYRKGVEFTQPGLSDGPNGKPFRIAFWGNRRGNLPVGRYPHYHRGIVDPTNPKARLEGQGLGQHRAWERG